MSSIQSRLFTTRWFIALLLFFFSGGSIYAANDALDGQTSKTAVSNQIHGNNIQLLSDKTINLTGVDIQADNSLQALAQDIHMQAASNEQTTYSKHKQLSIGLGDFAKTLTRPDQLIKRDDGKLSLTLSKAQYDLADNTTTQTDAVSSRLSATNIQLAALSKQADQGNIHITGSDLHATNNTEAFAAKLLNQANQSPQP